MTQALALAAKAAALGETPVGAIIVRDGRIIGRGWNRREQRQDVSEHAEMMAIRQASRRTGSWRLEGSTLYVTLEPCPMCAGALIQARIARLIYAAADPKGGACGSILNIPELPWNHRVTVESGIGAAESAELLHRFFQRRRRENRLKEPRSPARPECAR